MLLTAFDDRDRTAVARSKVDGTYTPPRWDKGEVGLALALNSPHEPVRRQGNVVEWGVYLKGADGNDDVVIENLDPQEHGR